MILIIFGYNLKINNIIKIFISQKPVEIYFFVIT